MTAASERALIAAVLADSRVLSEVGLHPADFSVPAHIAIWSAALSLKDRGLPVDQATLHDTIPAAFRPALLDAADLAAWSPDAVEAYVETIGTAALRRRLANAGAEVQKLAQEAGGPELADMVRSVIDTAVGAAVGGVLPTMHDRFGEYLAARSERPPAVPTPWPKANEYLVGGLRRGIFYVIGARPGVGKSAIALQLAQALANEGTVLFSSLEMPEQEVAMRVIAQQTRVPLPHLLEDRMTDWMEGRVNEFRASGRARIAIDDQPGVSVFDIRNRARSQARAGDLAGVVVDYIQLMRDPRDIARHEKVAEMTRNLKLLSRELNVPVIACSQLNRESQRRADSRPTLADLRESGSIEQDADVVMLLDREDESDDLAILLAKNRQGKTGTVWTKWLGEFVSAVSA